MKARHAFLCDFAEESGGKVHALGVGIDRLQAPAAPVTHPMLTLVADIEFAHAEAGDKTFAIELIDADGQPARERMSLPVSFAVPSGPLGLARVVVQIPNLRFESFGDYSFQVTVDGHSIAELRLAVWPLGQAASS